MTIICDKYIPSVKNKLTSCKFSPIFHEKTTALMPLFYQINVYSVKKTLLSCLYFPILHEKTSSLILLFCPKNVHSVKRKLVLFPFCPIFTEKSLLSWSYFVRNGHSLKTQGHTWSKKVHSLKKQGAIRSFFRIFHENPPSVMPIFCQKNVNSIETIIYNWPKMSLGCDFFQLFTKYSMLSCQYFV